VRVRKDNISGRWVDEPVWIIAFCCNWRLDRILDILNSS